VQGTAVRGFVLAVCGLGLQDAESGVIEDSESSESLGGGCQGD
jgi:hypothetical protein